MRIYVLAVLLLTFLLVSDSEEGWVRRATRRIRFKKVARFVKKNEPYFKYALVAARMGKRSAEPPCPPSQGDDDRMDQKTAMETLTKLSLECPNFGINGQKLTKPTVMKAFDKVDVDKDEAFDDDELKEFENVLDAYQFCADKGADQGEKNE